MGGEATRVAGEVRERGEGAPRFERADAPVTPAPSRRGSLKLAAELSSYGPSVRREDALRRRALGVADLVALALASALTWLLVPMSPPRLYEAAALGGLLVLWIGLNKALGLYDRDANLIHKSTLDELGPLATTLTLGLAAAVLIRPLIYLGIAGGRIQVIVFWGCAMASLVAFRALVRWQFNARREPERCLIVGSGPVAHVAADKINAHPEYGVRVVGQADLDGRGGRSLRAGVDPLVGEIGSFEGLCVAFGVQRIVVAFSALSDQKVVDVIRAAKRLDLKISIIPRMYEVIGRGVLVDELEGMTVLGLRGFVLPRSSRFIKRALDVVGAGVGVVVLSPLMAAIALAIKLSSRGPVFFGQERIGRHHRPFTLFKFRTMVDGAEHLKSQLRPLNEADGLFKIADDPRVTRVGRVLRRLSLDELPQLWNVLRGDMSLVGPRPLVPDENDYALDWHRTRLDLRPGMTGPWQVLGGARIPYGEMVRLDYLYVAEWSLWNDLKLILRTLRLVLRADRF